MKKRVKTDTRPECKHMQTFLLNGAGRRYTTAEKIPNTNTQTQVSPCSQRCNVRARQDANTANLT